MRRLNIVSIASVYPNPYEPTLGVFVEARLKALAVYHNVHVIVPVGIVDYSNPEKRFRAAQQFPHAVSTSGLTVTYVKWLYPPGGSWLNGPALFVKLLSLLKSLHRQRPIDILDAHFAFPEGVAAGLLARTFDVPYVITLRGNETMHCRKPLVRRTVAYALRRAALVIAVSNNLKAFAVAQGAQPRRVTTVPNGIDTDLFYPRSRNDLRQKRSFNPGEPIIVSVGYLIRRKGHDKVIRAVATLRASGIPAKLLIAGIEGKENPCEQELRDLVVALRLESAVSFLGGIPRSRMPEILSSADVLCLASSREGWPNVLNEALACGTPVVATDVGAARDIVSHPDLGYVVPLDDLPALAAAITAALTRSWDRDKIAEASRSRSWTAVGQETAALLTAIRQHFPSSELACARDSYKTI